MNLTELLKNENATLIDVREPYEFSYGHNQGAINIPLNQVLGRSEEIAQMSKPLILVCQSGNRSGMALSMLKAKGVDDIYNGGSVNDVERARMQTV
jgi:rhodanese-related sulfurtransferase